MEPKKIIGALVVCASLLAAGSPAQGRPSIPEAAQPAKTKIPYVIPRLRGPVVLDGLINEDAWNDISPLPMVMMFPTFGNEPSEKTEILVGFDDNDIYIAGRLYFKDPSRMQSPSQKRDYMESNTDWFGVLFDTFNDKENGLGFFTTPSGLRTDIAVFDDAVPKTADSMPLNVSWNTFWDVKSVRNDQGWFFEMKIPFSSLRFEDKEGRVIMGMSVWRWIASKNERLTFPAIYPKWGTWSCWKPSQSQEVVLEGARGRNPLYITPYGLAGYGHAYDLNEERTVYRRSNHPSTEAGLDVKVGLTSNLTLDLTLNTDFAQVEADDEQINLTRFSLFFPEKRLFFQERASIFNFNFDESSQLFYSRRIGICEGEAVRIYGGTRLVGRYGSWDLGVLNMQTAPVEDQPSENFSVLRTRRRVFNANSYLGGMIANRIGLDGSYNTSYGLDGILRISGDDYLLLNWAQTFENGRKNDVTSLDPTRFRFAWERRTREGLGLHLSYSRAGKEYKPGLGFEMREDFTRLGNRVLYGWIPGEKSLLQSHNIFVDGFQFLRNSDHTIESAEIGPGWEFLTKSFFSGWLSFKLYRESVRESFSFSEEAEVPSGEYTFFGMKGFLDTPAGNLFGAAVNVETGSFYDGRRLTLGVTPRWGISPDFSLRGTYEFDHVEFPGRHQRFTAHLARVRLTATLSTKFSASAFVQYHSGYDRVIANIRIRFNPREGNDLYLVYNEDFNTDRGRIIPRLPFSTSRAIMVKYSYTFNL